jgi:V/A-type H+/Na+-transporting ATPase subunit C
MAGLFGRLGSGGNYAYVSARVRAKKAKLLPPEEYPKLLAREASEIARALQEGTYKAEIDELAGRYRGAELVERATRLQLGRVYSQILSFATGELQGMIGNYLARYDAYNVKTILRGKFAGARPEEILAETIPTGALKDRLEELCRLEGVEAVVDALKGTPWGKVLAPHLEGRQVASLVAAENALDKAYYEGLVKSIPPRGIANRAFLEWARNEIDVVNLKTLFRLRFAGVAEWEPYFLEGGRHVGRETAPRIARGSDDEVLQELAALDFPPAVVDAARASLGPRNVNAIATALDKELLREASDFSHRAPLSVLPVVDFILRKKIEADNLRAIAYGKQTGLPNATIEELLNL